MRSRPRFPITTSLFSFRIAVSCRTEGNSSEARQECPRPSGRRPIRFPTPPNVPASGTRGAFRNRCEYRSGGSMDVSTDLRTSRRVRARASLLPGTSFLAPIQPGRRCLAIIDTQPWRFRFRPARRLRRFSRIYSPAERGLARPASYQRRQTDQSKYDQNHPKRLIHGSSFGDGSSTGGRAPLQRPLRPVLPHSGTRSAA